MNNKILFFISSFICLFLFVYSETNGEEKIQAPEFKEMYTKMLLEKRKAQHEAVKRIADLGNKKKENEMLKIVLNKLFETLKSSLENLAKKNKNNEKKFRIDKETIEDVSSVIENCAFASDLALRFPKYFHKVYDKNQNWQFTLETAISITLQSKLADETSEKAIYLMSQELDIVNKEPNYSNPFSSEQNVEEPILVKETKKKKEKKKRGPGLSGGKLDL